MKTVLGLAMAMLLAACAAGASSGTPGSVTARLDGQAAYVVGVR